MKKKTQHFIIFTCLVGAAYASVYAEHRAKQGHGTRHAIEFFAKQHEVKK